MKTLDALRQVHRRLEKDKIDPANGMMRSSSNSIPVVWIHDYQLMLAAAMIRQVGKANWVESTTWHS